jgi:hypothetical protein
MLWLLAATLHFVVLHTIDGREVSINPRAVTNLIAAKPDAPNELLAGPVRCIVNLTDGRFVTVTEHCDVVRQLLEEST